LGLYFWGGDGCAVAFECGENFIGFFVAAFTDEETGRIG